MTESLSNVNVKSEAAFVERIEKLRQLMTESGLDCIVLRRNPNLAWLTGGRVHVPTTLDGACLDVILRKDSITAVTNVIEAPRLVAEELPQSVEVIAVAWWEGRDSLLPTGDRVGSDQPGGGRVDLSTEIEILRGSLSDYDSSRLRSISKDSARGLEEAIKLVTPQDREIDLAGYISRALWSRDLEIVYIGVAGADRVHRFRHALPSEATIGARVVASICARRKGLICSTTRIVSFEERSAAADAEYAGLLEVEKALLDSTFIGRPFGEPVQAAIAAYGLNGFDADEWQNHHQGGPLGYLPRDWPASPTNTRAIQRNQPIAWNPTGKGWKVEDTFLVGESGLELLTTAGEWPTRSVGGRIRPEVLYR